MRLGKNRIVLGDRAYSVVKVCRWIGAVLLTLSPIGGEPALAQEEGAPAPSETEPASPAPGATEPAANPHAGGLFERDVLTGDWGGERSTLEAMGVQFGANLIAEVLSNPTGGVQTGAILEDRLELFLNLDLDKFAGWSGATFHVNAYQIGGTGLSRGDLGNNLLTVSNIEALPTTRLFDLWLQQQFANGAVSVRVGQLAADDEFFISQYAANFINSTFGWPAITMIDLPSGGPSYPLSTPGVRVSAAPTENLTLLGAVFNGDPAGPGVGDPQKRDPSGTNFELNDGVFVIGELAYAVNQGKDDKGLPATYKFGGWYNSNSFPDLRFDTMGVSLASPASNGIPANHSGNFGFYGVMDQMLWRDADNSNHGVAAFFRISGAPADRNLVSFYVDGGINYLAPFQGRDNDVLGLAVAYAGVSNVASALNRDANFFSGVGRPVQNYEMAFELTYKAQIAPWWVLQPDFQFILHPAGNVSNPTDPTGVRPIPNAAVLGLRTTIAF
jgi:porin